MLTIDEKIERKSAAREDSHRFVCAMSGSRRFSIETAYTREDPAAATISSP